MVGQKPSRSIISQTFYVPVIRSRKPSLAHHKSFSLVSVASPHLWRFSLMDDQASPEYSIDISHPPAASSQASTCSVEPGSAEDVGKIVSHHPPTLRFFRRKFHSFVFLDQAERLLG